MKPYCHARNSVNSVKKWGGALEDYLPIPPQRPRHLRGGTMNRFSDEELSRILSAHAGRQLCRNGDEWMDEPCPGVGACILQAAYVEWLPGGIDCGTAGAFARNPDLAGAFDEHYRQSWTPEELLAFIEAHS